METNDYVILTPFVIIIILYAIFAFHELPVASDERKDDQMEYILRLNQSMNGTERIELAKEICINVHNKHLDEYFFSVVMKPNIDICAMKLVRGN